MAGVTKAQLIARVEELTVELAETAMKLDQANKRADLKIEAALEIAALDKCVAALKTVTTRQKKQPSYGYTDMEVVPDKAAIARVLRYLAERFDVEAEIKS